MGFSVPKWDLKIPRVPVKDSRILEIIERALETYSSFSLKDIDYTAFGTFKLRVSRAKFLRAVLHILSTRGELDYTMELGSGGSTMLFGRYVAKRHIALEHLPWCHERTQRAIAEQRLERAEALLRDIDEESAMYSFRPEDISGPVDLLLIDGPPVSPKRKGRPRWERWNTLPYLLPHLGERAIVILDSCERQFEQEVLERWQEEYGIAVEYPGRGDERLKGFGIIDPFHSAR
jgi:hypothetical protein